MSLSKTLRRRKGWIAITLLAAVGVAAYLVLSGGTEQTATTVYTTEPAEIGTISVTVSGTGNLEVDGTTDVWPDVAGTVASVSVEEGALVATGTVLFTLDAAAAEANTAKALAGYRQSEQGVANAEASLARAESGLDELQELYDEQTETAADSTATATPQTTAEVTEDDLEDAQREIDTAEVALTAAKASLASSAISLEQAQDAETDLSVCAPCAGVVRDLSVDDGDDVGTSGSAGTNTAASGAPVVIAPEQPLALMLTVNEVDLPTLEVGQRADIDFDALPGLTSTGKVTQIAEEGIVEQGVVSFSVAVSIDVVDDALRPGMSGAASIVTEMERDTLLVSNAAVKSDGDGGYYVLVLDQGASEPKQVSVSVGLANSTQTQILSGINEGEMVVTQTSEASDEEESSSGFMMPGMGTGRPR